MSKFALRIALALCLTLSVWTSNAAEQTLETTDWAGDWRPLPAAAWTPNRATHLLERAGFGGTPEQIRRLASMTPEQAVDTLIGTPGQDDAARQLPAFEHSGVHDPDLEPFPPSRPATTKLAKDTGRALGIEVKPSGNRRLQPIVNRFFYWLRASRLETERVAYWWAERMLDNPHALQEKMALFWHGHFATNEDKVRDYRKMLQQLRLFHERGLGNFRELLIGVAQGPAMLAFLDAGVNIKGSPNENFAREIMELFTMGPGHYTEADIREAARAFTGWNYVDTDFVINADQHDHGVKHFLGHSGTFDGVEIIDLILAQPASAQFIATKLYRYFVNETLSDERARALGDLLRAHAYDIGAFMRTVLLSRDFYSDEAMANHIKSPVELVVSTYKKLGLETLPGVPDFNETTASLGQQLFHPPTVAGWAQGRSWITPGLLLARANFARDVLFPDIGFIAHDRYPRDALIRVVGEKRAQGLDISTATIPEASGGMTAMANLIADRDEDFNTRYGSYKGWQMAIERVIPIPRTTANVDLAALVDAEALTTTSEVVDYFLDRFLIVRLDHTRRQALIDFLDTELGTADIERARTYLEEPLRLLVHLILSAPEYQLG